MLDNEQILETAARREHWVRLTKSCNSKCLFCMDSTSLDGTCVPLKTINAELKKGRRQGFVHLNLSGGEPTLHPDFIDIIRTAKKAGYKTIQTTSNGRMFCYPDFLKKAVRAGLNNITFSIHGHTKKLHETATTVEGSFAQVMAALNNALSIKTLKVDVHATMSRINYKKAGEILDFFVRKGVSSFVFLQLVPFCAAWENKDKLFPDKDGNLILVWKVFEFSDDPDMRKMSLDILSRHVELMVSTARFTEYARMFEKFLRTGVDMYCRGKRCRYCYMDAFCRDLRFLQKHGRIEPAPLPPCAASPGKGPAAELRLENTSAAEVMKFFVSYRMMVKGKDCLKCKANPACSGMRVSRVLEKGFPNKWCLSQL